MQLFYIVSAISVAQQLEPPVLKVVSLLVKRESDGFLWILLDTLSQRHAVDRVEWVRPD